MSDTIQFTKQASLFIWRAGEQLSDTFQLVFLDSSSQILITLSD